MSLTGLSTKQDKPYKSGKPDKLNEAWQSLNKHDEYEEPYNLEEPDKHEKPYELRFPRGN